MFSALLGGGYISSDTTFAAFKGIFDETVFEHPIVWMKTQTSLMYFVHLAFKQHNPYDVWVKCVNCFRFIVKKGLMDTYDIQLKTIADNYLSTQNKNAINAKVANNNT